LGEEELGITFRNIFDKVGVAWMKAKGEVGA
jgi:hypothetical protein